MDRRTAMVSLLGLMGAGATLRWSKDSLSAVRASARGKVAPARAARHLAPGAGVRRVSLAQVPLGGGGFVTGIDLSRDGQRFACRTDVANAYVRDANEPAWRPLFSPTTMRPADYDPLPAFNGKADGQGVAGIRIAPSNKNIIYASYYGFIWKSVDGGRTVQRTRLKQIAMPSNAGRQRLFNRTIDVHATDPNRVMVGTWGEGAWTTSDGGNSWTEIKLPPAGKSNDGHPGIHLVLFDPTSRDRAYVFVAGVGLHVRDEGSASDFRSAGGGPKYCTSLVAGPDGTIYLCEETKDGSGHVWRYSTSAGWASAKPEHEAVVLAVDPRRTSRIVIANPNSYFMTSDDGGRTFRSIGGAGWNETGEVGWMGGLTTMFPAEMRFDPNVSDQLWIAQGVGVASTLAHGGKYQLEDWSAGIEELCMNHILVPPGGSPVASSWDKPFWRIDDFTSYSNDFRYPIVGKQLHVPALVAYGSYMDFARDDARFLVGVTAPSDQSAPGYSTDGGKNWQAFETEPATGWGNGGCIAVSNRDNIILLPSNNGTGVYTHDRGKTWSPIKLDGASSTSGFANAFYVKRKNIAADKMRPGTFALVYTVMKTGELYDQPLGGVWLTRDGGKSWQQTLKGTVSAGSHDPKAVRAQGLEERQFWQCQLEYVPGFPGELLYTPHADFAADRFYWSKDDGKSWVEPHGKIRNVDVFGFGKAAPGQSRPAVYLWCEINRKRGLYATLDWFATEPRLISQHPSELLAAVSSVTGDPDRFGRMYVGTSCAGVIRVDVEFELRAADS